MRRYENRCKILSKGSLFIVSAPSGAGKSTLSKMAVEYFYSLEFSVSYTTRPPREGETDGVHYRFIDRERFDEMVASDGFVEYASVHGNSYGTARSDLEALLQAGTDVILDIDVQGAEQIRANMQGKGVFIFILPPSMEECEARLKKRGLDDAPAIEARLKGAQSEIDKCFDYEFIIINDDLHESFERLKSIIIAVRSRRRRVMGKVKEIFNLD